MLKGGKGGKRGQTHFFSLKQSTLSSCGGWF
jgi:hypothetical protein